MNQFNEALDAYKKALELDPQNSLAWIYEVYVLKNLGRQEESVHVYDIPWRRTPIIRWRG